jgi:cbb3-type cytochrome oxidase subunit 3
MAEDFEVGAPPPEESSNRTFLVAAAGIGGLLILSMICLAVYALVLAPRQRAARDQQATEIVQENTRVSLALTQTHVAAGASATPTSTRTPAPTASSTPTSVVVLPSNTPILATVDPVTATAAAQLTAIAIQQALTPSATPTALPSTGFADEVGVPGLLTVSALLIVVVILARRMRMSSSG